MFICCDCYKLFEEPRNYVEDHGLDTPPYEYSSGCPRCGGAFVETYQCDNCGKWITGRCVKLADDSYYCENCYSEYDIIEGD